MTGLLMMTTKNYNGWFFLGWVVNCIVKIISNYNDN